MANNLITAEELQLKLGDQNLIVLDASMNSPLPGVSNTVYEEFIPGSRVFDIESVFIDPDAKMPHTMPAEALFQEQAQLLGLENDAEIVVYDNMGIYSSPRAWWMLKAMGASHVRVLDGGLIAWKNAGFATIKNAVDVSKGNFLATFNHQYFIEAQEILAELGSKNHKVLDARSAARFYGKEPEPRAGVRSGHVPGAQCLHFRSLTKDGRLLDGDSLKTLFSKLEITVSDTQIFSCGSGITACILALAASEAGYEKLRVFDGSWAHWGSDHSLPVSLLD